MGYPLWVRCEAFEASGRCPKRATAIIKADGMQWRVCEGHAKKVAPKPEGRPN
jgi:hypothetical protein